MNTILIIFLGIDGAGKTTLTNEVMRLLKEKYKLRFKYVWFRSKTQIYLSDKIFRHSTKVKQMPKSHEKKNPNNISNLCRNLILYPILFDYFMIIIFLIKIPMLLGYNIICDRYIYDIILDLSSDFGYTQEKTKKLLRLNIFQSPDIIYFINVPSDIAKKRRPEHSIEELNDKIKTLNQFKEYSKFSRIINLDGTDKLDILIQKIDKSLLEHGVVVLDE